jgi:Fur family ferric uptake transcriptional regulator
MSCGQKLREQGYRLTPQRMMVVEAIHSADRHISAEEIFDKVKEKYPFANISTVYRTLELLKSLDLVNEIDLGDGRLRYHPSEKGHHHHLICNQCGKIIDLPESILSPLVENLAHDYGFRADLRHLAVFGTCSDCMNSKNKLNER